MLIFNLDDNLTMKGATAAERICPWRRSSIPEHDRGASSFTTSDSSNHNQEFTNVNDPNLHPAVFTSSNYSGAYNKSSEYMGEFATTTKPEEHAVRLHVRDLFKTESRTSDETRENKSETAANDDLTRL